MINATGNRMTREIARQAKLAQDVAQTQIQLSTGKRLQRASDDPVASARVATLRTAQANNVAWDANIRLGQSLTAQADTVLASTSDLLVRAKPLSGRRPASRARSPVCRRAAQAVERPR